MRFPVVLHSDDGVHHGVTTPKKSTSPYRVTCWQKLTPMPSATAPRAAAFWPMRRGGRCAEVLCRRQCRRCGTGQTLSFDLNQFGLTLNLRLVFIRNLRIFLS